ncbi:hypothetical protein GCM10010112_35100 [Actinoplanes lobatus]|uniref:Lipoprotein n=1 Tax=Actinoplanes lobatus TaxID=113568 RepID=A0A7W7HCM2_9ACTN|nr:hypothetical protein [Actinoplanes lobatus]MBB4748076.1 hypothetical protein [Actinoplanes lobatus]GGN69511.1 hypothetical protein GCM10010112_35100 [Actinoplanes lobatus]GIE45778.1 hypothetical protein Alo02nite_86760 [Actinoplanes lobatus]
MRRTVAVVVGAVVGLAMLAGCDNAPESVDGAAAPAGAIEPVTSSPSPSVAVKPSVTPSRVSTSPSKTATLALGPTGVGKIKLGMSLQEALRTGLIEGKSAVNPDGCDNGYRLKSADGEGGTIWLNGDAGIVAIVGYKGLATPQGIEPGSSRAAVKAAYPKYEQVSDPEPADGRGLTVVPGNSKADYRIYIKNDKVQDVTLQSRSQGCYE